MPDRSCGSELWIGAREIGIEMIQKIDLEREIDIEMIGARELWIKTVDRYRPRGRERERERERERAYQKK